MRQATFCLSRVNTITLILCLLHQNKRSIIEKLPYGSCDDLTLRNLKIIVRINFIQVNDELTLFFPRLILARNEDI